MSTLWGDCEKHKVPLEIRYCENWKSYSYCEKCEKETSDRIKAMFNKDEVKYAS